MNKKGNFQWSAFESEIYFIKNWQHHQPASQTVDNEGKPIRHRRLFSFVVLVVVAVRPASEFDLRSSVSASDACAKCQKYGR